MYRRISNIVFPLFIVLMVTGCSVKDMELGKILEPVEKKFVYERPAVDDKLLLRVNEIVKAMSLNQLNLINKKYIHPTFGFYNLYKIKGQKVFTHQPQVYNIVEEKTEELSHLISRVPKKAPLEAILQENVTFKCSPLNDAYYGWSGHGIYLNDKTRNYLSSMMEAINFYKKDTYKKEDFHKAKLIEKTGYKLVLTPELIIYLTKIDNEWYISQFDRITTDCSSVKKGKKKK